MPDTHITTDQRSAAKRAAALSSVMAALGITLLKLFTGLVTGSLGMLSEAAHSGIDLIAAAITLLAVRVSDRPADEEHNYGHGKLESLSAAFEILLMLGSCVWIVREALLRILHPSHLVLRTSWWPFAVLLLSILVDFTRSRALDRAARESNSDALHADAIHFGTDIWSSTAVLVGLLATFIGQAYHVPALEYADPIAALIVACIILYVTWQLGQRTFDSLLDATPPEVRQQLQKNLRTELDAIPDVLGIERMRVRRSGSDYFVDLTLQLPRNLTFQRAEQVTFAATEAIQKHLENADVIVHTVPTATIGESIFDRIRAVAARSNLAIHDVAVQEYDGTLHVEQHLEVPESMPLRQAHEIATQLETAIRKEVPGIATLLTHIESEPATIAASAQMRAGENLENQLRATASHFPEIVDVHEIVVTRGHGGAAASVQINCHCTLPDDLPMEAVHEIITNFESEFRLDHPQVSRVLIHPEPATDNRR
ncbi:cation diffusion facilitator family transporter [Granulicella sp. 5B5]|uniref:cation diffusion facilitator family transporter n=1 Tax=Granulicella sp. 5B5 TaxID=1617967 RepID=UPI0015F6C8BB|nr:cation diffusion facilitator family transporter [Granulicella sp. 5B5]QMV18000.1 cation diffusion facilitator family transporter [Granulicella sp. 5B5]